MSRRVIVPLVVAVSFAFLSGCASTAEQPNPPEQTQEVNGPSDSDDPSFAIENPKNLKSVADKPCSLLTPEQLAELGQDGAPEPQKTLDGATMCLWSGEKFSISVTPITALNRDIKRIYEDANKNGNPERFRVDGYPAANIDKQEISGTLEVAVSDTESFAIDYAKFSGGTPEMDDPVGYAKKIATEVLKNIPDA